MTAFATHSDLAKALKRTFTTDEQEWVSTLLEQAAGYLRGNMQQAWVYPSRQSTYTAYPIAGRVALPQPFIRSVDSVQAGGQDIPWRRFQDTVLIPGNPDEVEVTFTYGLEKAPADLVGLNCAIVSGQITLIEAELGMQIGGLSSVALDDFKIAFADAGQNTGLSLPAHTREYLLNNYGQTAWVVDTQ